MAKLSRNAQIETVCIRCGETKKPVIRFMKADGMTVENYTCNSCRSEIGREELRRLQGENDDLRREVEHWKREAQAFRQTAQTLQENLADAERNETQAFEQGFNSCKDQCLRIVDEHEGFLARIDTLEPLRQG